MIISIISFTSSCYYDNEAALYPGSCATESVTFQGYVRPFIDINCTCHIKGSKNGNISLDGFVELKPYVTSGVFLKAIRHEPGVSPMPPATSKRNSCEISKLEAWVKSGALNN
jgi:hypothetical protein